MCVADRLVARAFLDRYSKRGPGDYPIRRASFYDFFFLYIFVFVRVAFCGLVSSLASYGECGFPTWLGMLNISVYSASFILRRDIQTQKHILRACRELSRRKKTSYRRNFKFSDFSVRREGASDTLYPTEVLAQDGPGRVVPVARSLSQSPVAGSFGGFAGSTSMFCLFCRMKNEGFDGGAVCSFVAMSSRPPASR